MQIRNSRILVALLIAELVTISGIQFVFAQLERGQATAVTKVIGSLLRDESTMSRSYLLAQSLEDMQTYGVVTCASLYRRVNGENALFYDSTFRKGCPVSKLETVALPGLDGNSWEFRVAPKIELSFRILKWSTLTILITVLYLGYIFLVQTLERAKTKQLAVEKQKAFLEELAAQVRHDMASPLGALKVIAEKAPLEPSTKAFLQEAVQRTTAIFSTLKNLNGNSQRVQLDQEINSILNEKRLIHGDFPEVAISVGSVSLNLSKVEFGRTISNLLDNAREAGATKVQITATEAKHSLRLYFMDNGKFIPEEVKVKLGNRGNTVGKSSGSGLGLFQSYHFMASIGGRLEISDRPGEKIVLTFPI